jgi:hypothetical protein
MKNVRMHQRAYAISLYMDEKGDMDLEGIRRKRQQKRGDFCLHRSNLKCAEKKVKKRRKRAEMIEIVGGNKNVPFYPACV